jgi:hypothetical protein
MTGRLMAFSRRELPESETAPVMLWRRPLPGSVLESATATTPVSTWGAYVPRSDRPKIPDVYRKPTPFR